MGQPNSQHLLRESGHLELDQQCNNIYSIEHDQANCGGGNQLHRLLHIPMQQSLSWVGDAVMQTSDVRG